MKNLFKLSTLALVLATTFATPVFAEEFIDNNDGTITHTPSGLIWQKCSVGQTYEAASNACRGDASAYKYADAMKLTSDFAGQTDWRMPTISELSLIVDVRKSDPAINKGIFSNTPGTWFWSASVYSRDYYFGIDFALGVASQKMLNYTNAVRLVRGEKSFSVVNTTDFIDNKDGTVTNTKTELTWQRCAVGQTWVDDGYCDGKAKTYTQVDAAKLTSDLGGKTDWRLPSYKELLTIVDYTQVNPATNLSIFPDMQSDYFWTATPKAQVDSNFWLVNFRDGITNNYYASKYSSLVRLVRGTLSGTTISTAPTVSGSVDLVSTLTASPSPAKINQTLTYTATVTNKGKANATGTTLTFYVAPRFMSYSTASSGCELKSSGLSVVCNVGDLAAGANVSKTMTVIMQKAGGVSSSVLAKSNEKDANPADNIGRTATGVKK